LGGCTADVNGLALDTGGKGAVNIGGGKDECRGGVGRGGAGLSCGVGPVQGLLMARLEDTVVGGGQLRGVTLPLLRLLTLLLQEENMTRHEKHVEDRPNYFKNATRTLLFQLLPHSVFH
jgi:hypothetical protein